MAGMTEKAELVAKVREVAAIRLLSLLLPHPLGRALLQTMQKECLTGQLSLQIASKGPEGEQLSAPAGYLWDPSCGLFYSIETGMYYDGASGAFCTPSDGKWWSYDEASGQFQALPAS